MGKCYSTFGKIKTSHISKTMLTDLHKDLKNL